MTTLKKASSKAENYASLVVKSIMLIQSETTEWNGTLYKTANEALYNILGKTYAEVQKLRSCDIEVVTALKKQMKERGYSFNAGTSLEAAVLRIVFNITDSKSKRIHRYAKALRYANADKIQTEDFVAWLKAAGGIDNVESKASEANRQAKQDSNDQKFNSVYRIAQEVVIQKDIINATPSEGFCKNFSVALVRHSEASNPEIVGLSNNENITKSLLLILAKSFVEEAEHIVANNRWKEISSVKKVARNVAVKQAKDKAVA